MEKKDFSKYIIDFSTIPYERKLEERALFPFRTLNFLTGGMELGEITIIAGETGCVDCDTEYFNGECWKPISEYKNGEKVLQYNADGTATLVYPYNYIKEKNDMFYKFKVRNSLSQMLTPEHRVVYIPSDYKNRKKTTLLENSMQQIYEINKNNVNGFTGRFLTSFNYCGSGIPYTDDELRLLVAVIADGAYLKDSKSTWCRMNLKKKCKQDRIRMLLKNADIEYEEKKWNNKDKDYINFIFYAPARIKMIPSEWYNCSKHQLEIIADELQYWDGHVTKTKINNLKQIQISTTIKQNADFYQWVYSATNHRASIHIDDRLGQEYHTCGKTYTRKSICYNIIVANNNLTGFGRNTKIEKVASKDGYKYCFTVPSSYLVLRRDNCIFISGNSGKSSLASQIVSEIIKHDKCFCIFGESTIEKQAHAQYRQMTPYNDNDYTFVNYYKDGQKTNIGKFFVSESAEKKIKELTAKRLFYYDPRGGMDIKSIMAVLEIAHTKGGINYFVIDNIMQIETTTNDEVKEMKDSFEQLRRFVIDNKVHCIVLAHYRKSNDYGVFRRRLEEIAGTSAIGNKCATALNIIRLDKVDRESKYSKAFAKLLEKNGYNFDDCDAIIEVLKTRHNKLGFIGLAYNRRTNTYYELKQVNDNIEKEEKSNVVISHLELTPIDDIDDIFGQIGF